MGNALSGLSARHKHAIDGGRLYALGDDERVYNREVTAQLISERKLAPFYPDTFFIDPGGSTSATARKGRKGSRGAAQDNPTTSRFVHKLRKRLRRLKLGQSGRETGRHGKQTLALDHSWFTEHLVDCPICMSSYPRNINRTCCCQQPICTQCFVHLRRPLSGRPISCPYCNAINFAVRYEPPAMIIAREGASETVCGARDHGHDDGDGPVAGSRHATVKVDRTQSRQRTTCRAFQPGANFYLVGSRTTTERADWAGASDGLLYRTESRSAGTRYIYPANSNPYRPPMAGSSGYHPSSGHANHQTSYYYHPYN